MRRFLSSVVLTIVSAALVFAQAQPVPSPPATTDDDIPVLLQHLPYWSPRDATSAKQAKYFVTLDDLKRNMANQPVLDSISFEGGTEAVTAVYAQGQLLIVEFATPQFSVENDQRIVAKIQELKAGAQTVPTAYRRVGNYSVFVFDGSDEASANQLIDQVRYEKVVQWLGEDPHLADKLQRYFAQTSAGVLIAVLKSSGLSLLACLAIGGVIGFLLFRQRRAQSAAVYSDAGGSVRLNLDELTPTRNESRLLDSPK